MFCVIVSISRSLIGQNMHTGIAWIAMALGLGHRPDLVKTNTHGPCYFLHRWAQRASCTPDPMLDLDLEVPLPPTAQQLPASRATAQQLPASRATPPPPPTFNRSSALCTADADAGNESQSRVRNNFSKLDFFIHTVL